MELTWCDAEADELAVRCLEPVPQDGKHEKVHDEVTVERPAPAVYHQLLVILGSLVARQVVHQRGLHAVREDEVEDEEDIEPAIVKQATEAVIISYYHVQRAGDDSHACDGYDERPRQLVAVPEEVERHGLQYHHDPVDDGRKVVDDRVTGREEQSYERKHDMQEEEDLNESQEAQRVGVAELDGLVRLLCRLRCGLVVVLRLLASQTLPLPGGLRLLAVAEAVCDDGELRRLVCLLIRLHGYARHGHRLGSVELGLPRDVGPVDLSGGKCPVYDPFGRLDVSGLFCVIVLRHNAPP